MFKYKFIITILCFSYISILHSSINIPVNSAYYEKLEVLDSFGLVPSKLSGFKQISRKQMAKYLIEAWENRTRIIGCEDCAFVDEVLAYMENEFQTEISFLENKNSENKIISNYKVIDTLEGELIGLDADSNAFSSENGINAYLDAEYSSFVERKEGNEYEKGLNFFLRSNHYIEFWDRLTFLINPEFSINTGADTSANDLIPILKRAYSKFTWDNFEIEVGKDSIIYGAAKQNSLLFSGNSKPIELIKVSNPYSAKLPWYFKYLGFAKIEVFTGLLGDRTDFDNVLLSGGRLSLKPFSFLEFGAEQSLLWYGDGAPSSDVMTHIIEFFGYRAKNDAGLIGGGISDRRFVFDLLLSFPNLLGLEFYISTCLEDTRGNHTGFPYYESYQFLDMMSYDFMLNLSRLTGDGRVSLALEYITHPAIMYRHVIWTSGYTNSQKIIGNFLGPDSDGVFAYYDYFYSLKHKFNFYPYLIIRDSDRYHNITLPPEYIVGQTTTADNPAETKFGSTFGHNFTINKFTLKSRMGLEYVWNYDFVEGQRNWNFILESLIEYKF
ncbi:MAG: capsule assembly Wzi family protein [Pseudomonadota bacterium]